MLWYPRKVAVLRESGYFVICDRGSERSRMQIFSHMGHFVRRIPIRFIDIVAGLAINRKGQIVAVDSVTPTIFILREDGELIKYIECSEYMTEPSDIAIFGEEYYICDFKGMYPNFSDYSSLSINNEVNVFCFVGYGLW